MVINVYAENYLGNCVLIISSYVLTSELTVQTFTL